MAGVADAVAAGILGAVPQLRVGDIGGIIRPHRAFVADRP